MTQESGRERTAAPAATGSCGIFESESVAHHVAHVVDLHAFQVLGAKRVHEDPDPIREIENLILIIGSVLNGQTALESRATPQKDRHPKSHFLPGTVIVQEGLNLGQGGVCKLDLYFSRTP